MLKPKLLNHFINFLTVYFHQDFESEEDVINELLNEETREYITYISKLITAFLNSNISNEDKINIVKNNVYIYYEDKNNYINLIENILNKIKKESYKL